MLQKTEGVVLRSIKCAGGALILDIYTEVCGRVQYSIGKGGRLHKGGAALAMPLSIVSLEADVRPSAPVHRLKEWKLAYAPVEMPFHPLKGAIALFMAELLVRVLHEQEANAALYAFVRESVEALDRCRKGIANFHLVFIFRLARYLGIFPNLRGYDENREFSLVEAEYVVQSMRSSEHCLPPQEARLLPVLARLNYANMYGFAMNREQRNRCLAVMMDYYHLHLPGMGEVRSVEVLQQLFLPSSPLEE